MRVLRHHSRGILAGSTATALSAMVLAIASPVAVATTYYVAPGGSDGNPGSEALPWKTLAKASRKAQAGDTVYLRAGTYKERLVPRRSGVADLPIVYAAYPGEQPVLDGSGLRVPSLQGLITIEGLSHIRVEGLRVIHAGPTLNSCGILVDSSDHIVLRGNSTYDTVSSGIGVWNSEQVRIVRNEIELACNDGEQECLTVAETEHFTVKNNWVHDGGPGTLGGEGIDIKDGSAHGVVEGNLVHHVYDGPGIYVDSWDKPTHDIQVHGNVVHHVGGNDGIALAAESGGLLENVKVYNNVVYANDVSGLSLTLNGHSASHPTRDVLVINNTFHANGAGGWGGGILVENPDVEGVILRNNILSDNETFQLAVERGVAPAEVEVDHNLIHGFRGYDGEIRGADAIDNEPGFVASSVRDYHLSAESPAVDAGSGRSAPVRDFDGTSRPQGAEVDIGAYELAAGARGGGRPTQLRAMARSREKVKLRWKDNSDTEVAFEVQMRIEREAFRRVAEVAAGKRRLRLVGLTPGTYYRFRVRALFSDGESTWSSIAGVRLPD